MQDESTSLLPCEIKENSMENGDSIKSESSKLICLGGPVMLTYLLEYMPGIVTLVIIGNIHDEKADTFLAAAALANMYINLTALSTGFGLATAMDTYASQACGKSMESNDDEVCHNWLRTYLLTGIFVLSIAFIPILIMSLFASSILIVLKQPPVIAKLTEQFVIILIPGIPFMYVYELMKKILQAKNVMFPMLTSAIYSNIIHCVLGYIFVYHTPMGWLGAAVARTVTEVLFLLFLLPSFFEHGLIKMSAEYWDVSSAINGIEDFFKLGFSGMLQMCFEWWSFEVLALFCGILPNPVQAISANAILMNISTFSYVIYLGLSIAGSVRVGNAVGASNAKQAKLASFLCIFLCTFCSVICAAILLIFRKRIPSLFTKDESIQILTTELMVVAAIFQIFDAVNAAFQEVMRGSGRQDIGAKLNFIAYYIIGLPSAALLGLGFKFGVVGLWVGITLGLAFVSIIGLVILIESDWESIIIDANERLVDVTESS